MTETTPPPSEMTGPPEYPGSIHAASKSREYSMCPPDRSRISASNEWTLFAISVHELEALSDLSRSYPIAILPVSRFIGKCAGKSGRSITRSSSDTFTRARSTFGCAKNRSGFAPNSFPSCEPLAMNSCRPASSLRTRKLSCRLSQQASFDVYGPYRPCLESASLSHCSRTEPPIPHREDQRQACCPTTPRNPAN